ncbi:MAG: carboxypeptidase regulatory-like domain-containing protein [Verrucomicrobia bacterium]|nr:carboxypeptidase regulatory-like domain-containing protein [Verrucomicrobiota bacterium]
MKLSLGHLVILLVATVRLAAAPVAFEWHTFLGPWEVSGPHEKRADGQAGLAADYLGGEAAASQPGCAAWTETGPTSWGGSAIMFSSKADRVSYARLRFLSPKAQPAVLALGADDGIAAFLNGRQVYASTEISNIYLDHYRVPVTLLAGENVLLLKVENWAGPSGALARLLPPTGMAPPAVEVRAVDAVTELGDAHLPRLRLEFLDGWGRSLGQAVTDGFRTMSRRPQDFVNTGGWRWYGTVPAGTARLRLGAETRNASGVTSVFHQEEVSWPSAKPLEFGGPVLEASGVVRGLDATGLGDVHFFDQRNGQPLPATVRPDGTFVLRGLRLTGDSTITVAAAGHLPANLRLRPPYTEPLNISLRPGGRSLRGVVRGPDRAPIAGAVVTARGRNGRVVDSFVTGPSGAFGLGGLEQQIATVVVTADADRYLPLDATAQLGPPSSEAAEPKDLQLALRPGATVRGEVRSKEAGEALPGVVLFSREREDGPGVAAHSDREGKFRLSGIAAGKATVFALSPDRAPAALEVETDLGRESQVGVALSAGKPITGRILDPQGKPIRGAVAYIRSWKGVSSLLQRTCRSDLQGRFEIPHMPADPCEIEFLATGFQTVVREGLKGGDVIDVVLTPRGSGKE